MTAARPERPGVTRRNVLRLGGAAIPAATLLSRAATPAQAVPAPLRHAGRTTSMQLTWMGHSCIRIERDGFVTVIDPGILSAPDAAAGADALLISHRHLDHYDTSKIAAAVDHDRGVPDPALSHDAHDLLERRVRGDGVHLGRVDLGDRLGHRPGAPLGERADDVPLAGDAVHRGAVAGDDDGADAVLGEHRQQLPDLRVRGDGDHPRAFAPKYVIDTHLFLPAAVVRS